MDIVVGIIRSGDSYAFLQRKDGTWTFPGGKVEDDEDLNVALVREVEEETGLIVVPTFNLGTRRTDGDRIIYKVCQLLGGNITLKEPDKFNLVAWMSADAIMNATDGHVFAPVAAYLSTRTNRLQPTMAP